MKVLFMGTPEFAVPTLEAIVAAGHSVVGVYTQPDKAVGRKQILTPPPVKVCAEKYGFPVFQPVTLRDGSAEENIRNLSPDIIVVVAYGKILPEALLNLPKYGCVNGHASLLPRHRGASPIQWSIVSGDKVTGVTTMYMAKGIDTGDMLLRAETEIGEDETAGELHDRLSVIGAELMVKTLKGLEEGTVIPEPQDETKATHAPIIDKEMGYLKFDIPATDICNLIKGFNPWPAAYFTVDGKRIKVFASKVSGKTEKEPGTVIRSDGELIIACAEGTSLSLTEIQPEGKKRMTAKDYLTGHALKIGSRVGQ